MRSEEVIFAIQHGSHLYGTNTPASDMDLKSVHLPSGKDILLQRVKDAYDHSRSKEVGEKNTADDVDNQSFAVQKLFNMLVKGDIIGMELIFTPKQNIIHIDPRYNEILNNKDVFFSKKVDGYVGYCRQQANKYGIRGSRVAAAEAAMNFFGQYISDPRLKVGDVYEMMIASGLTEIEHCQIIPIKNGANGQDLLHFECCNKKVPFTNTVVHAYQIYTRTYQGYGDRAKLAQANEGIDWKALSHAIRVGEQAIELLETGHITFPRPNAPRLLEIKQGLVPYKVIADELDQLLVDVLTASEISDLPDEPNHAFIEGLLLDLYKPQVTEGIY